MISEKNILLVIDDDPSRYTTLAQMIRSNRIIVCCVQNPDAVQMLLDSKTVFAVMLDHDMPKWDGMYYVKEFFSSRNIPVCITSANRVGSKSMADVLNESETPFKVMSVLDSSVEERWLGWVLQNFISRYSK